jgi:hypothetical protein
MDPSVLPYYVIYDIDQSILNSVFLKSEVMGITTVAMSVDDVIISVATILPFNYAQATKP